MIPTSFTTLVGIRAPIQLAAMPGVGTPELVAAVAEAGGLGMFGAPLLAPAALERVLDELAERTRGVVGVNFLIPFLDPACVEVAARRARVVEFFYGEPDRALVGRGRAGGALVGWQVGSRAEAEAAARAGCDFVVAQGTEAGGHVRGRTSLLPLISEVLDLVRIPVVAAGGIATARSVAAALACGAGAARIGTRFVAATESAAHPAYVRALVAASAADTCLTAAYSVGWPNAPHRVLRSAVEAANALPDGVVAEQRYAGRAIPVPRFSAFAPTADTTGHIEAMALYAGESVDHVTAVAPAAAIVAELVDGAERLLRDAAPRTGFEDVLHFWFPPLRRDDADALARQFEWWFRGGADAAIGERFADLAERAARGALAAWAEAPRSRLALILLLDQFPRSLHRGTPRAYAQDPEALRLALEGIELGQYAALDDPLEKIFFQMPLGHSEELRHVDAAVALAEELAREAPPELRHVLEHSASQARGHRDVVARFGRQPHRNAILGRPSTPDELAYLARGDFVHLRPVPRPPTRPLA